MPDCQAKTNTGKHLERGVKSVIRDIKDASNHINFIRRGVVALDDVYGAKAGMGLLFAVEVALDNLAESAEDNLKDIVELDAIASGEAPFIPKTRHEEEAIAALKRAQTGDFDLSLSRVLCRAVLLAEKTFVDRCKQVYIDDAAVNAVVDAVNKDQGVGHE